MTHIISFWFKAIFLALFLWQLQGLSHAADPQSSLPEIRIGDPLPPLSGDFLSGKKAILPGACKGKTALLVLGFTYESRHDVETWTARFRKEFGKSPAVTFFEIPMIGGAGRVGRWFIDSGMRRGTPRELHENVITVYGGTGPWKQRLRPRGEDFACLVLLDPQGMVRWMGSGKFDEDMFKDMSAAVLPLIQPR
jgi:hypothetical protein